MSTLTVSGLDEWSIRVGWKYSDKVKVSSQLMEMDVGNTCSYLPTYEVCGEMESIRCNIWLP